MLVAEQTELGFTNHQMSVKTRISNKRLCSLYSRHAGKNVLGHNFANFCPQLSGEWESFVRSLSGEYNGFG